jgi:phosphatidylglycerol---prolipoprotein diacylglyceryl transferase
MHPVAFEIGGFAIYWYGIFAALGFIAGFGTAGRRAPREGLTAEAIMNLAPWVIGGAVIGARILYVISYWKEDFANKPLWEVLMIRRSGLVFYGGLIGSCLGTIYYCASRKLPLWKVADVIAPSVALGHAFGRLGCLMTGCCYGRACVFPWAIHFPEDHWTKGAPVHPTQIYESLLNFGLYFGLAWLFRRKKYDGHVFVAYLIGYACLRAFVEYFRGDYPVRYIGGNVTPAQLVSIAILLTGLALWFVLPRRSGPVPSSQAPS